MRHLLLITLISASGAFPQPRQTSAEPDLPEGVEARLDIPFAEESAAQKLDLYLPERGSQSLRPAIVVVHGGGWRGGDKRRGQWATIPADYASEGYVAVSVNYRLTDEAPWPAQLEDVKAAVRWLRAHSLEYRVDPDRIGAYGNSAGAHLVSLLGLVRESDQLEGAGPHRDQSSSVQAVCASATPADFLNWGAPGVLPSRLSTAFLAGPEDTLRDRARQASPITYVRQGAPPFLLVHGTLDRTVPIEQTERFASALRDAGAPEVRYVIFDSEGHGVFQNQRLLTHPMMKAFFENALQR